MSQSGYIYILHGIGTNLIKIGKTSNFTKRFLALSQSAPFPLRILRVECVYDMDGAEQQLLETYRQYRSNGEWCALPAELLAQWPADDEPRVSYQGPLRHRKSRRVSDVRRWLTDMLRDGPVPTTVLLAEAYAVGLSERTLRRARASLEIRVQQKDHTWYWRLADITPSVEECA